MAIQTPEFPVITWPTTIVDNEVTISIVVNGGTPVLAPIPAGTYYGYESDATGKATTSSFAGAVAEAFNDATIPGFPAAGLRADYSYNSSGRLVTTYTRGGIIANITIDFVSGSTWTLDDLGVSGPLTWTTNPLVNTVVNDFNSAGYWHPNQPTCYDERIQARKAFVTEGIYTPVVSVVQWGPTKVKRTLTLPTTYAAYIWLYRRTDSAFATPAQVSTSDPNNLLEYVYEEASDGAEFRIYEDNAAYRTGYISSQEAVSNFDAWVEDVSARGAIWEVKIPFLDTGSVGGAS